MSVVVIRDLDALRERLARAISAGVDGTMLEFERFSVDYRDEMLAGADAILSLLREVAEPTDQDQRHVIHRRMVARQANWTCSVCGWLDPSTTKPGRCPSDQRETYTEWGVRLNHGDVGSAAGQRHAELIAKAWAGTVVRREVTTGPWVEVPS